MENIFLRKIKNTNKKNGALYYFSWLLTKTLPALSEKLGLKLLTSPKSRRDYNFRTQTKPLTHKINTKMGFVSLHEFKGSNDKHVLLSHGWADSTNRFTYLIDSLTEKGFNVWSIDHIGHGKSEGERSHLFGFIDGLENSLMFIELKTKKKVHALIGHSMGALGVLNLEAMSNKHILISMPAYFFENMFARVTQAGFSPVFLESLLNRVSKKYNKSWQKLSPHKNIHKLNKDYLIVHDVDDEVCSFKNLMDIFKDSSFEIFKTQDLGHLKILKDKSVHKKILEFI